MTIGNNNFVLFVSFVVRSILNALFKRHGINNSPEQIQLASFKELLNKVSKKPNAQTE